MDPDKMAQMQDEVSKDPAAFGNVIFQHVGAASARALSLSGVALHGESSAPVREENIFSKKDIWYGYCKQHLTGDGKDCSRVLKGFVDGTKFKIIDKNFLNINVNIV